MRKEPLSMKLKFSNSMRWSIKHAYFTVFEPLTQVLTFLTCSFLLVSFKTPASEFHLHSTNYWSAPVSLSTTFGWCSIDGLNLGEGNSCCKALKGLLTTECRAFEEFLLVVAWHHWCEGKESITVPVLLRRSPYKKHSNQFFKCRDGMCG